MATQSTFELRRKNPTGFVLTGDVAVRRRGPGSYPEEGRFFYEFTFQPGTGVEKGFYMVMTAEAGVLVLRIGSSRNDRKSPDMFTLLRSQREVIKRNDKFSGVYEKQFGKDDWDSFNGFLPLGVTVLETEGVNRHNIAFSLNTLDPWSLVHWRVTDFEIYSVKIIESVATPKLLMEKNW